VTVLEVIKIETANQLNKVKTLFPIAFISLRVLLRMCFEKKESSFRVPLTKDPREFLNTPLIRIAFISPDCLNCGSPGSFVRVLLSSHRSLRINGETEASFVTHGSPPKYKLKTFSAVLVARD
jgi:hypothetical protein